MTLPTFTPRPPDREKIVVTDFDVTKRKTTSREIERVVRWLWPCSACGETAVVDVAGRCRACWRALELSPAAAALDEALTLMENVPCWFVPVERPELPCAWCLFLARHGRGPLSHTTRETTGGTP